MVSFFGGCRAGELSDDGKELLDVIGAGHDVVGEGDLLGFPEVALVVAEG